MPNLSTIPGAIIGRTSRGPIRVQAGGSEPAPETTPPAEPPTDPAVDPAQETDWVAEARKWEARSKANAKAATELETLKASMMSDTEKAVAKAKTEGATEASKAFAVKLAKAEFKAAVAAKGLDLGDGINLIDTAQFLDDKGDVDEAAIKRAVTQLAKMAGPKAPGASGGDFGGGNGNGQSPKNLKEQIAEAESKGDWKTARQLKTQLMLTTQ